MYLSFKRRPPSTSKLLCITWREGQGRTTVILVVSNCQVRIFPFVPDAWTSPLSYFSVRYQQAKDGAVCADMEMHSTKIRRQQILISSKPWSHLLLGVLVSFTIKKMFWNVIFPIPSAGTLCATQNRSTGHGHENTQVSEANYSPALPGDEVFSGQLSPRHLISRDQAGRHAHAPGFISISQATKNEIRMSCFEIPRLKCGEVIASWGERCA